jgi:hypothetical protein
MSEYLVEDEDERAETLESVDLGQSESSYPEMMPADELKFALGSAAYPSLDDHLMVDSQPLGEAEDRIASEITAQPYAPSGPQPEVSELQRKMDCNIRSGSVLEVRVFVESLNVKVVDSMISQGYTLYTIETFTTLSSYPSDSATVHRRFSDFDWLLLQLRTAFPGVILPAFPDKAIILTDHFSEEFVSLRTRDLRRFLDAVTRHPRLALSDYLKIFLTSDDREFKELRRTSAAAPIAASSASATSAPSESYTWRLLGKIITPQSTEDDPYFSAAREKLEKYESVIANLQNQAVALLQQHRRLVSLHEAFFSATEGVVAAANEPHAASLNYFATASSEVVKPAVEFADSVQQQFVEDLIEAIRMVGSAKSSLAIRLRLQEEYQSTMRQLESANKALEKAQGLSSPSIPKQEKSVSDLQRKHDDLKSSYDTVTVVLRQELEDYFLKQPLLFKNSLCQYAKSNLDQSVQLVDFWRNQLNNLQVP